MSNSTHPDGNRGSHLTMIGTVINKSILVHLASGIGNIVLATPLLVALNRLGYEVDLLLHADYTQTAELLRGWSILRDIYINSSIAKGYSTIIPAVPPFYWRQLKWLHQNNSRTELRPPDSLFYQDEQSYYLSFAYELGCPRQFKPVYRLPIAPTEKFGVMQSTLVIAPGCKTGEMAAKRWPYFVSLSAHFNDVVVVGTADDLNQQDGMSLTFPSHVRMLTDQLTLRETAELLAVAGVVVGNDSGLSLIAAAVGTPTIMLFGPTPHLSLGQRPPNVKVLRANLECEPCWFGTRFQSCAARIDCLKTLSVERVVSEIDSWLNLKEAQANRMEGKRITTDQ